MIPFPIWLCQVNKSWNIILTAIFLINEYSALNNGLALTPPMGWLSWERFRCQTDCTRYPDACIDEHLIKRTANSMVSDGWSELGYKYLIIDDCWMSKKRNPVTHEIQPDPNRFSGSIAEIADFIHSQELLFGIYLDYGSFTCAGYPGSIDYLSIDAKSVAEWGADYVKMDACFSPTDRMPDGFEQFSRYMNSTGRPMVFSCLYPVYIPWVNHPTYVDWKRIQTNCNTWRFLNDMQDSWQSVKYVIESYAQFSNLLSPLAGPEHYNDPGLLVLGNFGLSHDQQRVHMGMWCMFAAPLILSTDFDTIDEFSASLLKNQILVAIDQDKGGHQSEYVKSIEDVKFWIRKLDEPASWAIALVNLMEGGGPVLVDVSLSDFESPSYKFNETKFMLKDVFTGHNLIKVEKKEVFTVSVSPTGIVMFQVFEI